MSLRFDVIVAGRSIAAYVAAIGFAAEGWRVAVVSYPTYPGPEALLPICHLSERTVRSFGRLGLAEVIRAASSELAPFQYHTPAGTVAVSKRALPAVWQLPRHSLQELFQAQLRDTPGVTLIADSILADLIIERGRITGLRLTDSADSTFALWADLVVAADGYSSPLSALAGVEEQRFQNGRFGYYAYIQASERQLRRPTMWLHDPDIAVLLPESQGQMLAMAFPTRDKQLLFGRDPVHSFKRYFGPLAEALRGGKVQVMSLVRPVAQTDIVRRQPLFKGMALIGEAALAGDPVWHLSESWAADSAFLLLRHLQGRRGDSLRLAAGLKRYSRAQQKIFNLPQRWMAGYASGRRFTRRERWLIEAAVANPRTALMMQIVHQGGQRADVLARTLRLMRVAGLTARQVARRTSQLPE